MCRSEQPTTLLEAVQHFSDEDTCFEFVVQMRWPDGVTCPHCGHDQHSFLSTRKMWQCKGCNKQFSVKKGTIFEDSPIKLCKWMIAMWLIANAKNGISSYELHRSLGVTQKTAWFMLHRIRLAMQNQTINKLGGEVEADEMYVGGKHENMHTNKLRELEGCGPMVGKTAVIGLLQRGGEVRTQVVRNVRKNTLVPMIKANVNPGAHLYTDALASYRSLDNDYRHGVVNHDVEYVNGNAHTNGLEGFWSLVKRTLRGTYVSVEPFHLFRYMNEYTYRYNSRKGTDASRFNNLVSSIGDKRLTYASLTGKVLAAA